MTESLMHFRGHHLEPLRFKANLTAAPFGALYSPKHTHSFFSAVGSFAVVVLVPSVMGQFLPRHFIIAFAQA